MPFSTSLRVLTYNIRFDNPDDPFPWGDRLTGVADLLRRLEADVFGLQEVLAHQLRDLAEALPEYAHVGVGRGPTIGEGAAYTPESSEHNPVFYRRERFEELSSGTFWLSSTPDVPGSQFAHTSFPRIATWVKLADKASGTPFVFVNTHFPYEPDAGGVAARAFSARVLLEQLGQVAGESPTILTGDFNLDTTNEADRVQTYAALGAHFDDAFEAPAPHQGPEATFFGFEVAGEGQSRIDYVFTSRAHAFTVLTYDTVLAHNGSFYFADHAPVVVELRF
jgi:endonuclease/exonuclease/phosphatase family metal-dependent hydrolase